MNSDDTTSQPESGSHHEVEATPQTDLKENLETRDTSCPSEVVPASPTERITKDLLMGFVITIVLLLVKWPIEKTPPVERLRLAAYSFMQHRLTTTLGGKSLPVAVVDISDVSIVPTNNHTFYTSRNDLMQRLDAIVRQRPKAVGVDVDFSPDEHGYISFNDPMFFDHCLALSNKSHIPIYLGVNRSVALPPSYWLGDDSYRSLAASLVIPRENVRSLLSWTYVSRSSAPCKTMSAALADAFDFAPKAPSNGMAWALRLRQEQQLAPQLEVQSFLVDYGPLERFEQTSVPSSGFLEPSAHINLQGKVVLLGDVKGLRGNDLFRAPNRSQLQPGVLLHACATYTLIAAPLYELTPTGRISLDVLLVVLIISAIAAIRIYGIRRSREVKVREIQVALTWIVIVTAFVGGVMFVDRTRVMWDDFPLVIIGLLIHQPVEHLIEYLGEVLTHRSGVHSRSPRSEKSN